MVASRFKGKGFRFVLGNGLFLPTQRGRCFPSSIADFYSTSDPRTYKAHSIGSPLKGRGLGGGGPTLTFPTKFGTSRNLCMPREVCIFVGGLGSKSMGQPNGASPARLWTPTGNQACWGPNAYFDRYPYLHCQSDPPVLNQPPRVSTTSSLQR